MSFFAPLTKRYYVASRKCRVISRRTHKILWPTTPVRLRQRRQYAQ